MCIYNWGVIDQNSMENLHVIFGDIIVFNIDLDEILNVYNKRHKRLAFR